LQSSLASKSDRAKQLQSSAVRPSQCCWFFSEMRLSYQAVIQDHKCWPESLIQAELEEELTLRRAELSKVEGLDSKLDSELQDLKGEMESLQEKLVTHRDLAGLADRARAHEARLSNLQASLQQHVDMLDDVAAQQHDHVQALGDDLMVRFHRSLHMPAGLRGVGVRPMASCRAELQWPVVDEGANHLLISSECKVLVNATSCGGRRQPSGLLRSKRRSVHWLTHARISINCKTPSSSTRSRQMIKP
jgi:predicted RNase H-like nuclease (RuvC/YqgF family)